MGMESTGCYWKTVFYALEERFDCWLINAKHLRNVPGRKSDVIDSRWCCELVELGLVRPSFVPPPEIRRLRDLTRLRPPRCRSAPGRSSGWRRCSRTPGSSSRASPRGCTRYRPERCSRRCLGGVTDPVVLAELAKGRLRKKIPQLQEALASRFEISHHGVLIAGLLAHIDALDQAIANLEARIKIATAALHRPDRTAVHDPRRRRTVAQILIAECGIDMTVFPTAAHFASWAAICPGTNQSGRKRGSGKTRNGDTWLRTALTQAAHAAVRTKGTYLASHYWQLRGRRGEPKRSARPGTTSSPPTTTSSATGSPTASSDPTGSPAATHPNTEPANSSNSSKRSATTSRSRPPPEPLTPRHPNRSRRAYGPTARARTNPLPKPAVIHTVGGQRFESVRGLYKIPANRRFRSQIDLRLIARAVGVERVVEQSA